MPVDLSCEGPFYNTALRPRYSAGLRLFGVILFFAALCLPSQSAAATLPSGFTEATVASGLSLPTSVSLHPDGRIFITEQGGALRVVKNGALLATPFLTVSTTSTGERGLLGVAFDPDYATNKYVYIYYTALTPTTHNRVSRFTADPSNEDVALAGSELAILDLETLSATNHNGGAIHFGPDGKLYIAVGENAVSTNAQSITTRLGKMLRINSDGTNPIDNPSSFPNISGTTSGIYQAIWTVGMRNPYTFSFQPGTGRMFINDVGNATWEEIDDGMSGLNYGWPTCEGYYLNGSSTTLCTQAGMTLPIYSYTSAGATSDCAITGGDFYSPTTSTFPAPYAGKYFFAEYCGGWIKYIDPASPPGIGGAATFATGISAPIDIDVANDGSLYYLARGGSAVLRVQYTAGSTPTSTPTNTPSGTATATPTNTPTVTATNTPTFTPTPVNCNTTLYGSDTASNYFTVNINTGAASLVGTLPFGTITEIEFDPATGRAFAQEGGVGGQGRGSEFNVTTGAAIGSFISNGTTFTGLEWVGSTLYGTSIDANSGPSTLRTLDPWTGATSSIGLTGVGAITGLAYDQNTTTMYGVTGAGGSDLYTINLATGAATVIGLTNITPGSLEFGADGNLYAGGGQGNAGNLYRINTSTGASTLVGNTGFGNISGLMNVCVQTPTPTATSTATATNTPTATPTGEPAAISGTVFYVNASAPPKFVSNVLISGSGSPNVSTTTAAPGAGAGTYILTGFGAGAYTVTPSKVGGVNGISSFDAARIAQHVAGIPPPLNANQLVAADASGNGVVSSFDAAQIAQWVVSGTGGHTGQWKFQPVNRMYPSVTGNITGENYNAYLIGEVSGNWTNTGVRAAIGGGPEREATINAPQLRSQLGKQIVIPIATEAIADKGIISYEFDLRYDPNVIQPEADPVDLAGTASRGLSAVVNANDPGLLRIAVYGAMPISANGVLLNLKFDAIGKAGSVSPLTWERIMFNEGEPKLMTVDGQVELSSSVDAAAKD
jgi:glucose/arabinose dehydrogenase